MEGKQVNLEDFESFKVTGKTKSGKRFSFTYLSYWSAYQINLFSGTIFGVYKNGKKKILKRVL